MDKKLFGFILTIFLITLVISIGALTEADAQLYRNYIDQKSEFQNYKALLYQVNESQKILSLHFLNGERFNFKLDEEVVIFADKEEIDLADLKEGDAIIVSLGPDSKIKFLEKIDYNLENNKELSDLGYRNDITIYGTDIAQDIFFPFSENMNTRQMQLYLNLEYSKFIKPDSKIIIKIEDEEIYLNTVSDLKKRWFQRVYTGQK
ncbi:MAG: hypothetical protein U5K53_09715 [Halanaerobiales bacterium]|nr:hypothetical protein [Halanaerobiales bacterium]